MKYIKNLEDKTQSVLAENIADDAAEISGLDKDAVADAIKGLNFANYLELGNAVSVEDGETIRGILDVSDVVPNAVDEPIDDTDEIDLEEDEYQDSDECPNRCNNGIFIAPEDGSREACYACDKFSKRYGGKSAIMKGIAHEKGWDYIDVPMSEDDSIVGGTDTRMSQRLVVWLDWNKAEIARNILRFHRMSNVEKTADEWIAQISMEIFDTDPFLDLRDTQKGDNFIDAYNRLPEYYSNIIFSKMVDTHKSFAHFKAELTEADNPSAPATASPTTQAATPPSAGSSIDALAQPADTATDVDDQEIQQARKEVEDLQIGDEIEVADIDGQPAAGRVRNLAGPGDTLIITGKGNEEHMIRKDSILSTPMLPVQEKKQARLDKTNLGKKNKRAERVDKKKKVDVYEVDTDAMREAYEAALTEGFQHSPIKVLRDVLRTQGIRVGRGYNDKNVGNRKIRVYTDNTLVNTETGSSLEDLEAVVQAGMEKAGYKVRQVVASSGGRGNPTDRKGATNTRLPRAGFEAKVFANVTVWLEGNPVGSRYQTELDEVAPPGMEDWIVKRKPEFKKRYGKKWQEVLYATAWKQHNNESLEEGVFGEETFDEMVEYWKGSLSRSMVSKGVFTKIYDAANRDIDELNAAIADEAYSIAETYHGSGEGIGSSDQNHFIASIASSLGLEDVFGWNKKREGIGENDADLSTGNKGRSFRRPDEYEENIAANFMRSAGYVAREIGVDQNTGNIAVRDTRASDKPLFLLDRGGKVINVKRASDKHARTMNEDDGFHFFVDPQAQGANVMNSKGEIHDYYDSEEEALQVAKDLNAQYGEVDEGKWDYDKRDKGKGVGTDSPMHDGGAKNRKNRKAFRKAEKAKAHAARMRGEVDEEFEHYGSDANFITVLLNGKDVGVVWKEGEGDWHAEYTKTGASWGMIDSQQEAEELIQDEAMYESVDIADMQHRAGIKETASGGATGAGAIASSPVAMNGVQKRNPSIYGQTKLKKKPAPKIRQTKEDASDGIGRSKKE